MARKREYMTSGTRITKHELPHVCTPREIIDTVIDSNQNTREQMRGIWVWKLVFSGEPLVLSIATATEPNVAFYKRTNRL